MSVAMQMITNGGDTEGLFRGAFMQSGSPIPVGDITHGGFFPSLCVVLHLPILSKVKGTTTILSHVQDVRARRIPSNAYERFHSIR